MKRIRMFIFIWAMVTLFASGCSPKTDEKVFCNISKRIARKSFDDGWVYTFVNNEYKNKKTGDSDGLIRYYFFGINIRHRYDEDFIASNTFEIKDGITKTEYYYPGIVNWIFNENNTHDNSVIEELLRSATNEELLALKPDDLDFTSLDPVMFCDLVHEALNGEPQKEGTSETYWSLPSFAALCEKEFFDGYKFQVVFMHETGLVDEIYIDLLYEDEKAEFGYVQLSDMCESGTATAVQQEIFEKLKGISKTIDDSDSYIAGSDEYKDLTMDGIEFGRLYDMLANIHKGDYNSYVPDIVFVE